MTEDEKVSTVKELIFQRLNIPANQQRLLYKGKALAGCFFFFLFLISHICKLMFLAYKSIIAYWFVILHSTDEHRLSDYSIGPEAKLNLVIRPSGEKTGASGAGPSSSTQGRVWQIASTILAKHFSPADASKVHENLIKVFEYILLNDVHPSSGAYSSEPWSIYQVITGPSTETNNHAHLH